VPSNKESLFQDHICAFLEREHGYIPLSKSDFTDKEFHIVSKHLVSFIQTTQADKYASIKENYGADTNHEIIKALKAELSKKQLWLIMRDGLMVKCAVKYHGSRANIHIVKDQRKTGLKIGNGGQTPPRTTIEEALAEIEQKYQISKVDAIVIKEICEDVSKKYDIRQKITENRDNENYLKNSAEPKVKSEVRQEYMNRELWEKLEDPIYIQRGGIISLMGKTIIKTILGATG